MSQACATNGEAQPPADPLGKAAGIDLPFIVRAIALNVVVDVALLLAKGALDAMFELRRGTPEVYIRVCGEGFLLGCLFSQLTALAIWTALFNGLNSRRLLLGTLAVVGTVASLVVLGHAIGLEGFFLRVRLSVVTPSALGAPTAFALLIFYLVQFPLWVLRGVLQLRIQRQSERRPDARQFSLLQLLGVMAFLAVPLALLRVGIDIAGVRNATVTAIEIAVVSTIFGVGALVALVGISRPWWGILTLVVISEMLVNVGSNLFMQATTLTRPADWPYVVAAFRAVQVAVVLVGVRHSMALRSSGYRLTASLPRWRRKHTRSANHNPNAGPANQLQPDH
jgi:hypothetical protein